MCIGGHQAEAGLVLRQAKEQCPELTLMDGDAMAVRERWQITGVADEGMLKPLAPDTRGGAQPGFVIHPRHDDQLPPTV